MGKSILTILSLILMVLFLNIVSANLVTNLDNNVLEIGDSNSDAGKYYDASFIINTTQNINYTLSSEYNNLNISFSQVVDQNQSTITITGFIPNNINAVDQSGNEVKNHVADLVFYDVENETNYVPVKLYMQRKNHLVFDRVILDSGDYSRTIVDGRKIDFLSPGDSATVEFKIKNTFRSTSDTDINDVEIIIYDLRDDLRIDEDDSIGRIRAGDDDTEVFSISISENVDEGLYDLILKVIGVDDFGAKHGHYMVAKIDIRKQRDDISINRADLIPNSINNCNEQLVRLSVDVKNIGRNNQRNVAISVENNQLNYYGVEESISLDKDDSKLRFFNIIIPENTTPGIYNIIISVLNDRHEIKDQRFMPLAVTSCSSVPISKSSQQDNDFSTENHNVEIIGSPTFSDLQIAQPVASHMELKSPAKESDIERSYDLSLIILFSAFIILLTLVISLSMIIFKKQFR
jgi:hypothetical protein